MDKQEIESYVDNRLIPKLKFVVIGKNIEEVEENTNVNFIFRITLLPNEGKKVKFYLKHAKDFVKKMPQMKFSTDRQIYETKGLELFHRILGDKVPEVVDYDEKNHFLIISDVEHGNLLANLFKENVFYPEAWNDFGKSLGKLHSVTYQRNNTIRSVEDNKSFLNFILPFRYMGALALAPEASKKHLEESFNQPACIIWGDPLRKNIFQTYSETFFFDFEGVAYYEPSFDIGYALAELIVEAFRNVNNRRIILSCIDEFIEGYRSEFEYKDKLSNIFLRSVKHIAAIMLHRSYGEKEKNSNRLDFDEDIRKKIMDSAVKILNADYKNPIEAFNSII